MFCRRFQKLTILAVLALCTSGGSYAATVLYAQTVKGVIYKSTDGAKTWQHLSPITSDEIGSTALAVDPQNTNMLYSIFTPAGKTNTSAGVFRSADGGQTWVETPVNLVNVPIAVDANSSNIVYAGGVSLNRSTDSGVSFQGVNPAPGSNFVSAIRNDPSQPGTVYVVITSSSSIYKSTDYGVTWALVASGATVFGRAGGTITDLTVDPKNSSVLYVSANSSVCGAAAAACGLLKSTDAGKTWQSILGDNFANVVVDPRNGNIYAGGYFSGNVGQNPTGEVVKSTDGGKTFTKTNLSRLGAEVHLDPESATVLYASQSRTVGANAGSAQAPAAGVYVSTDSGATWTLGSVDPALSPPNDQIYSLVALTIKNPPPGVVNVSAAGGRNDLFAPESIVSAFGSGLSTETASASTNPPTTTLGGATVTISDSAGSAQPAELLFVSPAQVNYIVPAGLAAGPGTVAFNSGSSTQNEKIQLGAVAPGMFTFNAAGLAAGSVLRVSGDGTQTAENLYRTDNAGNIVALPINLGPATDQVFLILYGTGFRAAGTANTTVTIGGQNAQVSFAGPQGAFAGLDQVNVLIPRNVGGRGAVNLVLTASGQTANTVNISVQ